MLRIINKKVLITGGTGSLGKRLILECLNRGWDVRVLSRDEQKQVELKRRFPSVEFIIGDIRRRETVKQAMYGINYVIHAAALKHIHICELNPYETIQTNVIGTQNLLECALEEGIERFVSVSTDKASSPVSVYGFTKALMERMTILAANIKPSKCTFSVARFGNMIGSEGSVVPLFREQIRKSGVVTVTDLGMYRFFLTLGDAARVVLYTLDYVSSGIIAVPKMKSTRLDLLIKALFQLEGKEEKVEVVGLRPGEKLQEDIVSESEVNRTTEYPGYYFIYPTGILREDHIFQPVTSMIVEAYTLEELSNLLKRMDQEFREEK